MDQPRRITVRFTAVHDVERITIAAPAPHRRLDGESVLSTLATRRAAIDATLADLREELARINVMIVTLREASARYDAVLAAERALNDPAA
jgi:hypothetical protein